MANGFSELLPSYTNLTQLTENQLNQPICVCGPKTIGSKFVKIRKKKKKQNGIINMFFHVLQRKIHFKVKDGH